MTCLAIIWHYPPLPSLKRAQQKKKVEGRSFENSFGQKQHCWASSRETMSLTYFKAIPTIFSRLLYIWGWRHLKPESTAYMGSKQSEHHTWHGCGGNRYCPWQATIMHCYATCCCENHSKYSSLNFPSHDEIVLMRQLCGRSLACFGLLQPGPGMKQLWSCH